ncbi:hypothetical protein P0082_03265 [Candidatus Haliotispira prima]|uniref:YD repeat-containing protein n=1 Tax=Candidatus Haliotispira prima TaxID=3034016 RepID=A0ABY8MIP4_9SPIO|nr:hypothetical protein P0082_03265 [Candidatus Haliotispira prima]
MKPNETKDTIRSTIIMNRTKPIPRQKQKRKTQSRFLSTLGIVALLAIPLFFVIAQDAPPPPPDPEEQPLAPGLNQNPPLPAPPPQEQDGTGNDVPESPASGNPPDGAAPAETLPNGSENAEAKEGTIEEPKAEPTQETVKKETRRYRSNQLGMALERLEKPEAFNRQQWGLEIESGPQQRLKTLYFRGRPRDTWLKTYRNGKAFQEQRKRGGILLENRFFDEQTGFLSEISTYSEETKKIRDRHLLFYDENGALERSLLYDGDGQLTRENNYRLDGTGQLVKLKIQMHTRNQSLVQYQLPGVDTFVQNYAGREKYLVSLYNGKRQNVSQILYQENVVTKRTNFQYSANGTLDKTTLTEPQRVTEYDYDAQGLLLQKQIWQSNKLLETEIYNYDKLGRLANRKQIEWNQDRYVEERYSYTGQNLSPQVVEFYLNSNIDRIRTYSDLYSYTEELYFDGVAVAKIYYSYGDQLYTEVISPSAGVPVPEDFN